MGFHFRGNRYFQFKVTFFKKRFCLLIFEREGKGERKRGREKIIVWLPLTCPFTGCLVCNPSMCPD